MRNFHSRVLSASEALSYNEPTGGDEHDMSLGEKISILRRQKGMSQENLAEVLDVSRQAVSRWEVGECLPDINNIVQLSKAFDVTTDYLLKNGSLAVTEAVVLQESAETKMPNRRYKTKRIFTNAIMTFSNAMLIYLILGFVWGYWLPGLLVFAAVFAARRIVKKI